ncbi:hypothetical protein N7519_004985 [Penicillium mononematosum]|uniref:uncharacterized protein n=1 Tax=Penicillium mononematosum TaxID=268346 RepID=UPI0025470D65|nr:uncharacterized protein N7519_004985 [Penicillium mononematosum]KAJ6183684.1 hypothetical protein N7519_004985 [Penicillium mononematosum]
MEYIKYDTSMYDLLNFPECPGEERGRLNPNIEEDTLKALYGELAGVLLQLSKSSFSRIGSPSQVDDLTWEVTSRPLSINSNELIRLGSLPQSELPSYETTFTTASSYFEAIAEIQIAHLTHQRNDAVESADDCRQKFVARCLFRKLARERKLTQRWIAFDKGPFKIWCDDLRPTNVLLNKDHKITGVVDWEFTYTAPIEFTYAPPWWLLIEKPEYWPQGLDDWTDVYDRRLQTFLQAMIDCENAASVTEEERLSGPMRESWESGDFWIVYAARRGHAFDSIYWNNIDQRFFGQTDNVEDVWRERLDLLSEEEKDEMEKLVAKKVEEMESRVLAWDPDEYTLSHIDIAKTHATKQAKKAEEDKEQEEGKEDDHKSEDNKAEVDAIDAKPIDTEVEQMAGKLAELAAA